jgi:UDP-N-acetylmuramate dehydrogenase
MNILENHPLKAHNTFGVEALAEHFAEARTEADILAALKLGIRPVLLLGGGSNILLTQNPKGLVLKNKLRGIRIARTFANKVWVEVGGGEVWHDFVQWAVSQGLGGAENLSLIPGTVGAAPIQNIGAYGVELKDIFVRLRAIHLENGQVKTFSRRSCRFGYRDSVFKQGEKGKWCIVSVVFSLTRHRHRLNLSYGDIAKTLEAQGVGSPGIAEISRAVMQIRTSKLPDPAKIGNCGSFFKNPEISKEHFQQIQSAHSEAPHYPLPNGMVKVPAGWLIEMCGWKGKRVGNTGCYEKQALVLVNHGGATGAEVHALATEIIRSVDLRFGVRLEPEVNIW